jgi:predicted transcriptional regulator
MQEQDFGKILKKYKDVNGLTYRELSEQLDINVTSLHQWVHGKFSPRYSNWKKIAQKIGNIDA